MSNYQYLYIVFLVVFGISVFTITTVDFSDKGECVGSVNGDIRVRQPNSKIFVDSEFCIIIKS